MPQRLSKSQRARVIAVIDAINSEDFNDARTLYDALPETLRDWPIWSAGENMPGYLPDSPYSLFYSERAAIGHCRSLERDHDDRYATDYMQISLRECF